MEVPVGVHDQLEEFPPCPEHITLTNAHLSEHSKAVLASLREFKNDAADVPYSANKLVCTLLNKEKYKIHYLYLKYVLQLGLKVTKIHRVLSFKQTDFARKFIDLTARLRIEAKSDFEKDQIKKISNSVYGKYLANPLKYIICKVATTQTTFEHAISHPSTESFRILSEQLVLVYQKKSEVEFRQAWLVGGCVLDLSKLQMASLFTEIQVASNNSSQMLFTDTDSFAMLIQTPDENQFFAKLKDCMDFSNYPRTHVLFNENNKGCLGYLKNEMKGTYEIAESCAIRSKCYSLHSRPLASICNCNSSGCDCNKNTTSKCKGTPGAFTRKILFDDYKKVLLNSVMTHRGKVVQIRSKNHTLLTLSTDRKLFTSYDDKKYALNCNIHSRSYGHFKNDIIGSTCEKCNL